MKKTSNNLSEEYILDLLLRKDPESIKLLYDLYGNLIYGIICRIIKNEAVANEVLQKAFLIIWDTASSFDPQKSSFLTWALQIARSSAHEALWSKKYLELLSTKSRECNSLLPDINVEDIEVKNKISQLSEDHQRLLEQIYIDGRSYEEIAQLLNMPFEQVSRKVRAAFQELRDLLMK
ncbi:MAG: sigma-70 family RNA polymerase sigma factor [Bacteroidota bacterium]